MLFLGGRFNSAYRAMACASVLLVLQLASGCSPDSSFPSAPPSVGPGELVAAPAILASGASVIHTRLAPEKCLTIPGGSTTKGTQAVIQPCTGADAQKFDFKSTGEIRYASGQFCLDAYTGKGQPGDKVVIWPCNGGANQKWSETSAGEIRGINGLCVDVWAENPADGQPVVVYTCHGSLNQQWNVQSASATVTATTKAGSTTSTVLPPVKQSQLALAFDPAPSLSNSSRVGPVGSAVGTPTYVAGPPARFALDSADAIDFGAGALDNVWTGTAGWTYLTAVQTGAKPTSPNYILVKESSTNEFALFRNKNGGLEFVVYTPAPNYENIQTAAVADYSTLVVAVRYNPQLALGKRVTLFINGAAANVVSHTYSGTGGKIAASSARLRMGIVERGLYRSSPAVGAAYVYSGVLTDSDVTTNTAWVSTNRRWTTSQTSQTAPVASVTLSPTTASVNVGGKQQFTATLKDANGNVLTGRSVAWASSKPTVASVSTAGMVTGVAAGTSSVTATSEGKSATVPATVTSSTSSSSTPPPSGGASWQRARARVARRP